MSDYMGPDYSDLTTIIAQPVSRPRDPWPLGSVMDERFYVEKILGGFGSSGMGIVYVVRDGDRRFAAKTFQHQFAQDITLIERFMREAQTWMLIGVHPHIVRPYFLDIIAAVPYLFMEYVDTDHRGRRSLADYLASGPLEPEGALDFAIQCSAGMAHATARVPGLVHRDLKPENLLINGDLVLKVTDFGLVRFRGLKELPKSNTTAAQDDGLTQNGAVFGTPAYMAPEQFIESGAVTMAADIYAFGCCFYEAISSRRVFSAEGTTGIERLVAFKQFHQEAYPPPLREATANCSVELDELIMKCLRKDPSQRWSSFDEIHDRLVWIYERDYHRRYSPITMNPPSERQRAEQTRSLTLLQGYSRAIRLRTLRENQDNSPYAFHLALASYFHSQEELAEERRQLQKAQRVREGQQGYEVVRRLADLMIDAGEFAAAGDLLERFLETQPESLDYVLEPYVRMLIARGDFTTAENTLARLESSFRATVLRLQLLQASGQNVELASTLRGLVAARLPILCANIALLDSRDVVGWEYQGDWDVLACLLALIAPECDTSPLATVTHAVWPDLTGAPDFSPDMAYLSEAYGKLAELDAIISAEDRAVYAKCAALLGYPTRLARHLVRDELWFWTLEGHQNGSGI